MTDKIVPLKDKLFPSSDCDYYGDAPDFIEAVEGLKKDNKKVFTKLLEELHRLNAKGRVDGVTPVIVATYLDRLADNVEKRFGK